MKSWYTLSAEISLKLSIEIDILYKISSSHCIERKYFENKNLFENMKDLRHFETKCEVFFTIRIAIELQ